MPLIRRERECVSTTRGPVAFLTNPPSSPVPFTQLTHGDISSHASQVLLLTHTHARTHTYMHEHTHTHTHASIHRCKRTLIHTNMHAHNLPPHTHTHQKEHGKNKHTEHA